MRTHSSTLTSGAYDCLSLTGICSSSKDWERCKACAWPGSAGPSRCASTVHAQVLQALTSKQGIASAPVRQPVARAWRIKSHAKACNYKQVRNRTSAAPARAQRQAPRARRRCDQRRRCAAQTRRSVPEYLPSARGPSGCAPGDRPEACRHKSVVRHMKLGTSYWPSGCCCPEAC